MFLYSAHGRYIIIIWPWFTDSGCSWTCGVVCRCKTSRYLELALLIAAAQGYERHFEGLPHRIQVVFNHLLERQHISRVAEAAAAANEGGR